MATYQLAARDRTTARITLVANAESTVEFADDVPSVAVISMSGDAPIWLTFDDTPATVDGKRCVVIPAAVTRIVVEPRTSRPTRVRMISTGTPIVVVGRG